MNGDDRSAGDVPYEPIATKGGRTFKGCCKLCKRPIYSGNDHAEDCIYG